MVTRAMSDTPSGLRKEQIRSRYEERDFTPPEHPKTGEILTHTEWLGFLWCEREREGFEWQTGVVECPHCGEIFKVKVHRDQYRITVIEEAGGEGDE